MCRGSVLRCLLQELCAGSGVGSPSCPTAPLPSSWFVAAATPTATAPNFPCPESLLRCLLLVMSSYRSPTVAAAAAFGLPALFQKTGREWGRRRRLSWLSSVRHEARLRRERRQGFRPHQVERAWPEAGATYSQLWLPSPLPCCWLRQNLSSGGAGLWWRQPGSAPPGFLLLLLVWMPHQPNARARCPFALPLCTPQDCQLAVALLNPDKAKGINGSLPQSSVYHLVSKPVYLIALCVCEFGLNILTSINKNLCHHK